MPAQICLPRSQGLVSAFNTLGNHLDAFQRDPTDKRILLKAEAFKNVDSSHLKWRSCDRVYTALKYLDAKLEGRSQTRCCTLIRSELARIVQEISVLRENKLQTFDKWVSKEEVKRFIQGPRKDVCRLETQAAYIARFSREKRIFMNSLANTIKTLSVDELKKSILFTYEKLEDLIAYAKSEKYFLSDDEIFDDLFENCLMGGFTILKEDVFEFVKKINKSIKEGKYDFKYLLFEYYFQREAIYHVLGLEYFYKIDPFDAKLTYEKVKKEGIKEDRLRVHECIHWRVFEYIKVLLKSSSMTELVVTNSRILRLSRNTFKRCPNLSTIIFSACRLSTIKSHTFSNLPEVKNIKFNKCCINKIEAKAIENMPQLSDLYFLGTTMEEIKDKAFCLSNLTEVSFTENPFQRFRPEIFEFEGVSY